MKKKISLTLAAVLCALFCVLGVAACDNPADKIVKGSAIGNDYIHSVQIAKEGSEEYGFLFDHTNNKDGKSKQYQKGKYHIEVYLYNRYGMGNMKMLVNDAEVALSPRSSQNTALDIYECDYNVTEDFEIKFSGEIERKTVNISVDYTADDWKDRIEDSYAIKVRMFVNGNDPATPFQSFGGEHGASLESFIEQIADNPITVKADDHVDIYVYSNAPEYKVNSGVLSELTSSLKMTGEAFTDGLGRKGYHYQFDVKTTQASLRLSTHSNNISVIEQA